MTKKSKYNGVLSFKWFVSAILVGMIASVGGLAISNTSDISDHKLYAAQTYTTKADLKEMENRMMAQFNRLYKQIDRLTQ